MINVCRTCTNDNPYPGTIGRQPGCHDRCAAYQADLKKHLKARGREQEYENAQAATIESSMRAGGRHR